MWKNQNVCVKYARDRHTKCAQVRLRDTARTGLCVASAAAIIAGSYSAAAGSVNLPQRVSPLRRLLQTPTVHDGTRRFATRYTPTENARVCVSVFFSSSTFSFFTLLRPYERIGPGPVIGCVFTATSLSIENERHRKRDITITRTYLCIVCTQSYNNDNY